MQALWVAPGASPRSFLAQLGMSGVIVTDYGAPAVIWVNFTVHDDATIGVELQVLKGWGWINAL
jgi:hypothetical protein